MLPPYVVLDTNPVMPFSQTIDWGLAKLDIPSLHKRGFTGKGVKIAILDTGCDLDHPDLVIASAKDFTGSGSPEDEVSHGTHVAGIIAAQGNDFGVLGVAPGAEIHIYKVLSTNTGRLSDVANAIYQAISDKMDIINMSLGAAADVSFLKDACKAAAEAGIIVVASSGNSSREQNFYPAAYPYCFSTGAINSALQVSGFTSYGATLEWVAPGERILSTYLRGGYAVMSGTSMAAPWASGAVALMKEAGVSMNYDNLVKSTIDILEPSFDKKSGWGILKPHIAIDKVEKPSDPNMSKINAELDIISKSVDNIRNLLYQS